jgi:hypothetical protein
LVVDALEAASNELELTTLDAHGAAHYHTVERHFGGASTHNAEQAAARRGEQRGYAIAHDSHLTRVGCCFSDVEGSDAVLSCGEDKGGNAALLRRGDSLGE